MWLIIPFKILLFFEFNLYRGMWRYTGINDLINLIKSTFVGSTVIILALLYLRRFEGYPRSVFAIDVFLTLIFIGGSRLAIRVLHQALSTHNLSLEKAFLFVLLTTFFSHPVPLTSFLSQFNGSLVNNPIMQTEPAEPRWMKWTKRICPDDCSERIDLMVSMY